MKPKAQTALFTLAIAAAFAACDGADPTPTGPTRDAQQVRPPDVRPPYDGDHNPAFQVADVTLSGFVFENTVTGRRTIEGVIVANGEGNYGTTDASGFYSIRPVWVCPCPAQPRVEAGMTFLWVTKDGYADPPGTPASVFGPGIDGPGTRDVRIDGDTRFDIELVPR